MKGFVASASFMLIILASFAGDFFLFGLPAFFFIALPALLLRILQKISLSKAEVISVVAASIFLCGISLWHASDLKEYYWSFSFIVVFLLLLQPLEVALKSKPVAVISFCVIVAMSLSAFLDLVQGVARSSVLFGPNVYYRIAGFFGICFLISSSKSTTMNYMTVPVLFMTLLVLGATGSRGAIPVAAFLILMYLLILFGNYRELLSKFGIFAIFISVLLVLFLYWGDLQKIFWRLLYFDATNASISTRQSFVSDFFDYISAASAIQFFLGDGESQRVFSFYPHNLFLEGFVYHGAIFALIGVMYVFALLRCIASSLVDVTAINNLPIVFAPIFLGSLFSGSLMESYSIFAVAILLAARTSFASRKKMRGCLYE